MKEFENFVSPPYFKICENVHTMERITGKQYKMVFDYARELTGHTVLDLLSTGRAMLHIYQGSIGLQILTLFYEDRVNLGIGLNKPMNRIKLQKYVDGTLVDEIETVPLIEPRPPILIEEITSMLEYLLAQPTRENSSRSYRPIKTSELVIAYGKITKSFLEKGYAGYKLTITEETLKFIPFGYSIFIPNIILPRIIIDPLNLVELFTPRTKEEMIEYLHELPDRQSLEKLRLAIKEIYADREETDDVFGVYLAPAVFAALMDNRK